MSVNTFMKVVVKTLVDITQTNARRGDEKFLVKQQANYMTIVQTVGLRVNPIPISIEDKEGSIKGLEFGTKYTGKQRYWTFTFEHEYKDGLTLEMLIDDFDLIPIITGLNETINIAEPILRTKNKETKNIIFEVW